MRPTRPDMAIDLRTDEWRGLAHIDQETIHIDVSNLVHAARHKELVTLLKEIVATREKSPPASESEDYWAGWERVEEMISDAINRIPQ